VQYQGVESGNGKVTLRSGGGRKGEGIPPLKVSVQEMIVNIQAKFEISDDEALYIRQVTEEKAADPVIRSTVTAHRMDGIYLHGAYHEQINREIQSVYEDLPNGYEALADPKYTDHSGIFDLMAYTVIQHHLGCSMML
jgi:type I restriction enzyme R subunit